MCVCVHVNCLESPPVPLENASIWPGYGSGCGGSWASPLKESIPGEVMIRFLSKENFFSDTEGQATSGKEGTEWLEGSRCLFHLDSRRCPYYEFHSFPSMGLILSHQCPFTQQIYWDWIQFYVVIHQPTQLNFCLILSDTSSVTTRNEKIF